MINMAVRGDSGNFVARAEAGVQWTASFADLDPAEFPMLRSLDPYGDAVFNQRQVPLLLAELDRLPADLGDDWVVQARELCQVVERGLHLYLWFIGD
ncbi:MULTISPECIES: hypothetical protein [Streptomyces]|uniref:hypothetical protein n=1 Tax=Streptomyces TaxID=1883 RepID=UPI00017E8390|nr:MULTISPECIES: hypothetical protein [Streptomyces]AKL71204.1 hypothetical protein M444_38245 [Streptomyces sp. Mg1]AYV32997.1 hypothetical protein EES41_40195 [Streptomyces sp. ADI95-16]EDX25123.1 conserved hypothetical protein [Streptomyces sp. Mg1]RPK26363.1 hypothetical protein EES37_37005 [Streptomyces sp. ADI91-18]WBY24821.1 hypothetical protein PET44_34640 [Streptomyces goshikiensis]